MHIIDTTDEGTQYVDLTHYVPAFIGEMSDFAAYYLSAGIEELRLRTAMEDLIAQNLVSTCTWSLSQWASIYGVSGSTDEAILEKIYAKMRTKQTCTIDLIVSTALEYTGETIVIEEDYANYSFTITFISCLGAPDGIDAFIDWLDIAIPAHLTYTIAYTYNTWGDAADITWADAESYTWDTIRYTELGG